jgi:1,2-diacylglycerol 3-beta-glucosyltransferase
MARPNVSAFSTLPAVAMTPLNAYLLALLAAAAWGGRRAAPSAAVPGKMRFAVLVPARDEEAAIGDTLASLDRLDYPHQQVEVIVLADNCRDRTPQVAADAGATVWRRHDDDEGGKGAVLAWGLDRVLAERPDVDAVALIDADCAVAPNLLGAVEARMGMRMTAVQVAYGVANPEASWTAGLRYASFTLVNLVRPLGKATLGLSAGLLGTGMAFTRDLIASHRWSASSLLEDQEHHLRLVAEGERVVFARETWVRSAMPTSLRRSSSQLLRWDAGRVELIRRWVPPLVASGLRRRDAVQLHAAMETFVPPQSLLVAANVASALLALPASRGVRRVAAGNLAAQACFVVGGLALARAPAHVWRALAFAPALAAWKLRLLARLWLGRGPTSWVRTEREPRSDARPDVGSRPAARHPARDAIQLVPAHIRP